MTQKTNSRKSEAAGETRGHLRDAAHTARQNFEHATRAGERIQEQAGTWLRSMMSGADLQRFADSYVQLTSNTVPLAQRGMRQLMELMETNSRTSVDLMKKATDAFQAPLTGESQAAWMQFWTASTKAAQTNAEGLMEFGTRAINSWAEFVRNIADVTSETGPSPAR